MMRSSKINFVNNVDFFYERKNSFMKKEIDEKEKTFTVIWSFARNKYFLVEAEHFIIPIRRPIE